MTRCIWAVFQREFGTFTRTAVGWTVVALFQFLTGLVFVFSTLVPGEPASLRYFFATSTIVLIPVAPAISMRAFSEEYRSGTIETLLTAPVSDAAVVLGKFLACWAFVGAMLLPTLLYPGVLFVIASGAGTPGPEIGPLASGYLSLMLAGGLYVAIGLLASSLTSSQMLAFLMTLFVLVGVLMAPTLANAGPPWVVSTVDAVALGPRIQDFARGLIDPRHVLYFLSITTWLVTMTAMVLAVRRAS
jgi:ABC-2 type transport system permease protein